MVIVGRRSLGSNFHECVRNQITNKEWNLDAGNEGYWKSLQNVFKDVGDVPATEVFVYHDSLYYQGKFDCICYYK